MTEPAGSPAGSRQLDAGTVVLVGVLGVVLVAGFVVLAALGRDTTSYLLFLGGPAVSGIVGALLSRRVTAVTSTVETRAAETRALVEDSVSDLDNHLTEQDDVIERAAADARVARLAVAGGTDAVPGQRLPAPDLFGPIAAGIVRRQENEQRD